MRQMLCGFQSAFGVNVWFAKGDDAWCLGCESVSVWGGCVCV